MADDASSVSDAPRLDAVAEDSFTVVMVSTSPTTRIAVAASAKLSSGFEIVARLSDESVRAVVKSSSWMAHSVSTNRRVARSGIGIAGSAYKPPVDPNCRMSMYTTISGSQFLAKKVNACVLPVPASLINNLMIPCC